VWHDPNPWPKKPSDTTPGNPGHINRDPAEVADTYFALMDLGTRRELRFDRRRAA
jgi:hypothetical protein